VLSVEGGIYIDGFEEVLSAPPTQILTLSDYG
jgi:hypothetical protein